jgi:hypothetical protein
LEIYTREHGNWCLLVKVDGKNLLEFDFGFILFFDLWKLVSVGSGILSATSISKKILFYNKATSKIPLHPKKYPIMIILVITWQGGLFRASSIDHGDEIAADG